MTRVSHPRFEMTRAEALNNTIECGACFVGERLNCNLIFKNIGGPGKFFMMTEMQWSTQDINVCLVAIFKFKKKNYRLTCFTRRLYIITSNWISETFP